MERIIKKSFSLLVLTALIFILMGFNKVQSQVYDSGRIEGRVTNADGTGMYNAKVEFHQTNVPSHATSTDADGYYSSDVQSGTISVRALTPAGQGIKTITVTVDPDETEEVNFVWIPGKVQGRVTNADGTGMYNAKVEFHQTNVPSHATRTDADGYYSSDVQSGTISVRIKTPTGIGICSTVVNVPPNTIILVSCGMDNTAPIANWKSTLTPEGIMALDGSESYDEDGQIISYDWQLNPKDIESMPYNLHGKIVSLEDIHPAPQQNEVVGKIAVIVLLHDALRALYVLLSLDHIAVVHRDRRDRPVSIGQLERIDMIPESVVNFRKGSFGLCQI